MIQVSSQSRILLAAQPVDFRKGIDGLCALCRRTLNQDPYCGSIFVFRNRRATAIKILIYDGQGFWLCMKRLSSGRLTWWPNDGQTVSPIAAKEFQVLLWNGDPNRAALAKDWRKIA